MQRFSSDLRSEAAQVPLSTEVGTAGEDPRVLAALYAGERCQVQSHKQFLFFLKKKYDGHIVNRQRGDSNPCGQSPMDFESISLTARTHCHCRIKERTKITKV